MTDQEFCSYAGVYQAYAWHQGFRSRPTEFRIPDEHFSYSRSYDETGFDLVKFFEVVAEIDDGGIHQWQMRVQDFDTILTLACTEDDSMTYMLEATRQEFYTAFEMLETLKANA